MTRLSNEELLQKASMSTSNFGGAGEAPLTVQQVEEFMRLAITPQVMLSDVKKVNSSAAKWQESKIDFENRIMRAGSEGDRLGDSDRYVAATGIVEISTVLIHGELRVTDEVMEDQVEGSGFGDTLMAGIAERVGSDVEYLFVNGDTTNVGDTYLVLQDGWFKQAQGAGGNVVDATANAYDYKSVLSKLITALPNRFKRDLPNMRFYAPTRFVEMYRNILADRGTGGGDLWLEGTRDLMYQGVKIVGVPLLNITSGSPDTSSILLTHKNNLYAGWRRVITIEKWRDPREHATSYVISARVNSQIAHVPATAIAINVNLEP